ncbi:MAG: thioredoxin domain-containing protein, partial [Clostridiales bacterium]|nr:thioredoxin domain-containing protein [Clostridiales bacterium]
MTDSNRVPNRLVTEKSPYLLQHAYNPVDWYPWGDEAFEKAKREDKPVFLSIGYSTCHWCHVMERESFEDQEVADYLNAHFVAIKVDKEERPDVDAVYMQVCQALTGSGGWPLTVFLAPDKKAFFAGTYFPKTSRYGMNGLMEVLASVVKLWKHGREKLLRQGDQILKKLGGGNADHVDIVTKRDFHAAYETFRRTFDEKNGGFGYAPKFPTPNNLMFLLRHYYFEQEPEALEMTKKTLRQMYRGGIFDHIGGGFSRYSTDDKWLVPHFEKMLYDNALLTLAYL